MLSVPVGDIGTIAPASNASTVVPEGVKVCNKCGFAFSEQFVSSEAEPLCAVCSV